MRMLAWCGPTCVVATIVALVVVARFIPPPPAYLDAEQVAALYASRPISIRLGLFLAIGATSLLIPFSAAISVRMAEHERGGPVFAAVQLVGGATGALILITAFILMMTAAFESAGLPAITKALHDAGWLMLLLPYSPFCIQYLAIARTSLASGADRPFPRWVGYYNVWIAISFIPTGFVAFFTSGPFTWHGVVGFWIPTASYAGWFLVMAWALLRPADDGRRIGP